jgi:hypothetical protein
MLGEFKTTNTYVLTHLIDFQDEMLGKVNAVDIAASAGQARCLEVALAHGHWRSYPKAMAAAVAGGYVECVMLLHGRGNTCVTECILATAAKLGHTACVQYVAPVLQDSSIDIEPCAQLHRSFSRQRGVPGVCDAMAEQGELVALQTLVRGGCAKYMDWRKRCGRPVEDDRGKPSGIQHPPSPFPPHGVPVSHNSIIHGRSRSYLITGRSRYVSFLVVVSSRTEGPWELNGWFKNTKRRDVNGWFENTNRQDLNGGFKNGGFKNTNCRDLNG